MTLACQYDSLQSENGAKLLSHYAILEELMVHLNVRVAQKSKELKEKLIPEREAELKDILGVHIPYKVFFGTFSDENQLNFVDNVSWRVFPWLADASLALPRTSLLRTSSPSSSPMSRRRPRSQSATLTAC